MFLGIGLAFGTGFRHDGLVVEVLIAFDVVIVGGDGHLNARLEDLVGLALGCRRIADFSGMGDGSSGRKAQNRNRNDHQQRAQANPCTTK